MIPAGKESTISPVNFTWHLFGVQLKLAVPGRRRDESRNLLALIVPLKAGMDDFVEGHGEWNGVCRSSGQWGRTP